MDAATGSRPRQHISHGQFFSGRASLMLFSLC
jgi:hypothetical protein